MCEAAPRLLWIRKVAEDVLSSGRCVTQVTVYYITQSTLHITGTSTRVQVVQVQNVEDEKDKRHN